MGRGVVLVWEGKSFEEGKFAERCQTHFLYKHGQGQEEVISGILAPVFPEILASSCAGSPGTIIIIRLPNSAQS